MRASSRRLAAISWALWLIWIEALDSAEETSLASRTQVVSGASMRPASSSAACRARRRIGPASARANAIAPASERASRQAPDDARMCQPRANGASTILVGTSAHVTQPACLGRLHPKVTRCWSMSIAVPTPLLIGFLAMSSPGRLTPSCKART